MECISGLYGMPVSGSQVPGIITTQITHGNLLNGGMFGIEGGIFDYFLLIYLVLYLYGNTI